MMAAKVSHHLQLIFYLIKNTDTTNNTDLKHMMMLHTVHMFLSTSLQHLTSFCKSLLQFTTKLFINIWPFTNFHFLLTENHCNTLNACSLEINNNQNIIGKATPINVRSRTVNINHIVCYF